MERIKTEINNNDKNTLINNNSKLILILGDRGSGKTLLLTRFILKNNQPFYSNYKVYKDSTKTELHELYHELQPEELLHLDMKPKKIAITEAYEYFESRLGMGSFQRYNSYIVFQSRKRGMSFIIDTQLDDTIDHRFIRLCDYIIIAELDIDGFHYYCSNKKIIKEFIIPFKNAEKIWNRYDSWEVVTTPQIEHLGHEIAVTNRVKLKEKLTELETKFYNEYGEKFGKKKITHAVVENFLLEIDESDVYESFLYAKLQKPIK